MLRVRYPDGTVLVYNKAHYLTRDGDWRLYTAKDGDWIASIMASAGVAIEVDEPDYVERDEYLLDVIRNLRNRIIAHDISGLSRYSLKELKKALTENYNSTHRDWK